MILLHPTSRLLQRWSGGRGSTWITRHVERCDRCSSRLDSLAPLSAENLQRLREAFSIPDDLKARLARRLQVRAGKHETLWTILDLYTLGWETTRVLLEEKRDDG